MEYSGPVVINQPSQEVWVNLGDYGAVREALDRIHC